MLVPDLGANMRRRKFLGVLGGATAAWPVTAYAQQPTISSVVGYLNPTSPDANAVRLRAFRDGIKEFGYAEGENVAIEYRWAENQMGRLLAPAADLAQRQVAVIATAGGPAAFAAKTATNTIPIVFTVGDEPSRAWACRQPCPARYNLTGV